MLTAASALLRRLAPIQMVSRRDKVLLCLIAILHLTALGAAQFFLANPVPASASSCDHLARTDYYAELRTYACVRSFTATPN
jgi:hypothetical protein